MRRHTFLTAVVLYVIAFSLVAAMVAQAGEPRSQTLIKAGVKPRAPSPLKSIPASDLKDKPTRKGDALCPRGSKVDLISFAKKIGLRFGAPVTTTRRGIALVPTKRGAPSHHFRALYSFTFDVTSLRPWARFRLLLALRELFCLGEKQGVIIYVTFASSKSTS